nr:hypothetical protein HmN_000522700 [Hymenolepis microstoma]
MMQGNSSTEEDTEEVFTSNTEKRFMRILYKYADSSLEDKRFLIVSCENVFGERDDADWMLSTLETLASLLEEIDLNATNSRHKLPDVPSDSSIGRNPWTFTPHNAQYITYLMSRLIGTKAVDVRSRNLIHKIILRQFRDASCTQVKAALLRFSKYFVRFLTPAEVKEYVLPLVPLCLNSRNLETLVAAMEALPKLVEYPIAAEIYEKCLKKAINAFKKSSSRPQIQSVAIQCVVNIISQLSLDLLENILLPFALEATAEAANNGGTVRVSGGNGEQNSVQRGSASATHDVPWLIPGYLIEFDFFLSQGEPVISLCCLLKTILRERRSILSPSMIALEILPCLLPHTLNKQWQFSEFKYVMSTLYEYLNFLNEANPTPLVQESPQANIQRTMAKCADQNIKVRIDRGSTGDDNGPRESISFIDPPRCIQRRGSGNIILPLKGQQNDDNNPDSRPQLTLEENAKSIPRIPSSRSNNDEYTLLPQRPRSSSNVSGDAFKSFKSSQNVLSSSNLLTVSVCEGPFGLPDKNRRRSAIDLRSTGEIFNPMQSRAQQILPTHISINSPKKSQEPFSIQSKLNILGVLPNIRRASENALNMQNASICPNPDKGVVLLYPNEV